MIGTNEYTRVTRLVSMGFGCESSKMLALHSNLSMSSHVKGYGGSTGVPSIWLWNTGLVTWQLILSGGRKNERNHQQKSLNQHLEILWLVTCLESLKQFFLGHSSVWILEPICVGWVTLVGALIRQKSYVHLCGLRSSFSVHDIRSDIVASWFCLVFWC